MTNRLMGAGDESKYALLGGFEIAADSGQGRRGASGFTISPLLEKVSAAVYSAYQGRYSTILSDFTFGGGRPRNPGEGEVR